MTLGWGLVNQLVAPLVSVSGTHFVFAPAVALPWLHLRNTPPRRSISLYSPQSELDAEDTLRRGIRPRGISIESLILFVHVGGM